MESPAEPIQMAPAERKVLSIAVFYKNIKKLSRRLTGGKKEGMIKQAIQKQQKRQTGERSINMNRSNYDGEMIPCPKCGKEYASFYQDCPYCEADRVSRAVIKHGRMRGRGEVFGALILCLLLVAGGVYLAFSAAASGGLTIGREYAVETATPETMQVGVTEQEIFISTSQEPVPVNPDQEAGDHSGENPEEDEDGDSEQ